MEIKVRFLDKLRLEASFDDFKIVADQPLRYKGDGSAPSPFDYFMASSALCAAYFVNVYCRARDIPTDDISITQNNVMDPHDRYKQTVNIQVGLPEDLPEKHRQGILRSIDRCTVKRVIQNDPTFEIQEKGGTDKNHSGLIESHFKFTSSEKTNILGKDAPLEDTILKMSKIISDIGIRIEIASWRNIVENIWSVHVRDVSSPLCFSNGKGATKESALCSALGEFIERLSCNYFYNDFYLGQNIAEKTFVHYPNEKWFPLDESDSIPQGLMDEHMLTVYNPNGELQGSHLLDMNSGLTKKGVCAIPFVRQSDKCSVFVPVNLIGNLFVSNGMSAGNTLYEARVQSLSEIFERAVKKTIIEKELALPDIPREVIDRYPKIKSGIEDLERKGFPLLVKDASLGGKFPVINVTLMNPKTGGVFASFGAHPKFEVALERTLTELMQGRSFESFNDLPNPTFNSSAVSEPNNFVEHFVDSTGIISWKFFSKKSDFKFVDWNIAGNTKDEHDYLLELLEVELKKEVYIADYSDLGANACRIIVPDYSEIYPADDLIWDNTNRALYFRKQILHIHELSNNELRDLCENLEQSEMDNYTLVSELIGVAFDENSVWGNMDVGELKIQIYLATCQLENAQSIIQEFLTFNDNTADRTLFYRLINTILDIQLDPELNINDFKPNLIRMFGQKSFDDGLALVEGTKRFHGMQQTNLNLDGIERHQNLIESYLKLHNLRFEKYHLEKRES